MKLINLSHSMFGGPQPLVQREGRGPLGQPFYLNEENF